MAEREQDAPRTAPDSPAPEGGRSDDGTQPARENDAAATDQAIANQERALESGDENVV